MFKVFSLLLQVSFKDPVKKNRGYYLMIVVYNQTKIFCCWCRRLIVYVHVNNSNPRILRKLTKLRKA